MRPPNADCLLWLNTSPYLHERQLGQVSQYAHQGVYMRGQNIAQEAEYSRYVKCGHGPDGYFLRINPFIV